MSDLTKKREEAKEAVLDFVIAIAKMPKGTASQAELEAMTKLASNLPY